MKLTRLPKDGFDSLFSGRHQTGSHHLFDVKIRRTALPCWRTSVLVPKRVAGRAVDRNRIKRLVRESVRLSAREAAVACDVIFRVRVDFSGKTIHDIYPIVREMLKKACSV